MKRLNITLFAMFVAMISYAQTTSGVWNSTTSTYTNTQHGIRWKLIEEWDWEENLKRNLHPHKFSRGSEVKVHWKCKYCGAKWIASQS